MPACQRHDFQDQTKPDYRIVDRRARPDGMRQHKVSLQFGNLIVGDANLGQGPKPGIQPINRLIPGQYVSDGAVAAFDRLPRRI